jgi:hypothetical protein
VLRNGVGERGQTGQTHFLPAPDFIIPDEFNPVALIEAKLAEDDGTVRDKVARVQRLRTLRDESGHTYDVIACIAGRGFKVLRWGQTHFLRKPFSTAHSENSVTRIIHIKFNSLEGLPCILSVLQ